jgi:hypothetical protein
MLCSWGLLRHNFLRRHLEMYPPRIGWHKLEPLATMLLGLISVHNELGAFIAL